MTNEDIIKKWLAGELTDEEKKEFESSAAYTEIRELSGALQAFKAPEYDTEKEYEKLSERVYNKNRTISIYDRIKPALKIAAIFILTLTMGYFIYSYFNTPLTNNSWITEQTEVYLPDSSFVALNTDSKIRFTEKQWKQERNVELEGEAFFKVKKGSTFNVITGQGKVTVLGTEFDVKDWEGYFEVTCFSGSVKVITEENTLVLEPNEAFQLVKGNAEQYTVTDKAEPDWLKGESSFNSIPLHLVIAELERQYGISVEAENVDLNRLFTGSFSNTNLKIALESVTVPVNLNYEIEDKKVVIKH